MAVVVPLASSSLAAQVRIGVGGGVLLPTGTYNTTDKAGWVGAGDVTYWLPAGALGVRAEASYGQTTQQSGTGNTKIAGGMAELVWALGRPADLARFYVLGGIGAFNVNIDVAGISGSETKVGFGAGGGVALKLGTGSTRVLVEGRYTSVSTSGRSISFIPIRAGVRFGT